MGQTRRPRGVLCSRESVLTLSSIARLPPRAGGAPSPGSAYGVFLERVGSESWRSWTGACLPRARTLGASVCVESDSFRESDSRAAEGESVGEPSTGIACATTVSMATGAAVVCAARNCGTKSEKTIRRIPAVSAAIRCLRLCRGLVWRCRTTCSPPHPYAGIAFDCGTVRPWHTHACPPERRVRAYGSILFAVWEAESRSGFAYRGADGVARVHVTIMANAAGVAEQNGTPAFVEQADVVVRSPALASISRSTS